MMQTERAYLTTYYERKFRWYDRCVYCGCAATELDHVFPVSIARKLDLGNKSLMRKLKRAFLLVPCCGDCNRTAGCHPFLGVKEKRTFIQSRLQERHKKILKSRIWDDDELEEITGNLRREIIKTMRNRLILEYRITYPHQKSVVSLKWAT
jgi:hypothetical protein